MLWRQEKKAKTTFLPGQSSAAWIHMEIDSPAVDAMCVHGRHRSRESIPRDEEPQKATASRRTRRLSSYSWLRGLDLNQRPLGYEFADANAPTSRHFDNLLIVLHSSLPAETTPRQFTLNLRGHVGRLILGNLGRHCATNHTVLQLMQGRPDQSAPAPASAGNRRIFRIALAASAWAA